MLDIYETNWLTGLIKNWSRYWLHLHDTNMYVCIQLYNFLKLLLVLTCLHCVVSLCQCYIIWAPPCEKLLRAVYIITNNLRWWCLEFDSDWMSFEPSTDMLKLHARCFNFCENCFCLKFYALYCEQLNQSLK